MMFRGLRSRCTTPFSCAASSAATICRAIASASLTFSPRAIRSRQRLAFDELEDQGAHARRLLDAVDRRDVRVIQRRQRPCLSFEAGQSIRIAR